MFFTIIGLSDSRQQWFPPEVAQAIAQGKRFSGGKRHREIVAPLLPAGSEWIDITVPLEDCFVQYEREEGPVVVFASGDPLFYGIASTLQRRFPGAQMRIHPTFHSLQLLAHRMLLPYAGMRCVSLTGRPWDELDEALIESCSLIGCLTDRKKGPHEIARRMRDYGYTNYEMTVGERLGNDEAERVLPYETTAQYAAPNCVILRQTSARQRPFGVPDAEFVTLPGRPSMITKTGIRLLSLSLLDLRSCRHFWDIGFCTGSVSIEARLQFPHLGVTAFEIRPECEELLILNSRRHGAPGIQAVMDDFLEADLADYPSPDAAFIGGHGGRLADVVRRLSSVMPRGGRIVFNSVSETSRGLFLESLAPAGFAFVSQTRVAIDEYNPIHIMKAIKTL